MGRFHESLWEIAENHLGDGRRYREIFELNKDLPQPDGSMLTIASLIRPGWVLRMPHDAFGPGIEEVKASPPARHSGRPHEPRPAAHPPAPGKHASPPAAVPPAEVPPAGDLGADPVGAGPAGCPHARRVGSGRPAPGPGPGNVGPGSRPRPAHATPPRSRPPRRPPPTAAQPASPQPGQPGAPGRSGAAARPDRLHESAPARSARPPGPRPAGRPAPARAAPAVPPPRSYPLELAAAGLLAAGVLAALERRRRKQARRRPPGRRVVAPQPDAAWAEAALRLGEDENSARMLDAGLRHLSRALQRQGRTPPTVFAAHVGDDNLDLWVTPPSHDVPAPWYAVGDGQVWRLPLADVPGLRRLTAPPCTRAW